MSFTRAPDPTPVLNAALGRFDKAQERLAEIANSAVRPLVLFRLGAIAMDVSGSAAALRDAHAAEVQRWFEDEASAAAHSTFPWQDLPASDDPDREEKLARWQRRLAEIMTPDRQARILKTAQQELERKPAAIIAFGRYGATFKAFFYFARAYQDVLYVGLSNAQGRPILTGSMANALKAANPVGVAVARALPNYVEWFSRWRDQRNRWKLGNGHHIVGPAPDIGMGFLEFNEQTRGVNADFAGEIVRLRDAAEALDRSSELTEFLVTLAQAA